MTRSPLINRRAALAGLGALAATPALAAAPMLGPLRAQVHRVTLGGFEVTTVWDGAGVFDGPHPIFGQNQTPESVAGLMEANGLPPARFENNFTPVVVNTGAELVLFDTGNGAGAREAGRGKLLAGLAAAGYAPEQIDVVVVTHFHPDHIGGLMENGAPAFPNARYVTGAAEFDFWTPEERLSGPTERVAKIAAANVKPLADRFTFLNPGDAVAPGIEAVDASGHTPGMLAYHIESDGRRLMLLADTANHYVASVQRPEWHVSFDMDKEKAVAARKRLLGMIAADRVAFTGYHMPFPAVGFLEERDGGFRYEPATYHFAV